MLNILPFPRIMILSHAPISEFLKFEKQNDVPADFESYTKKQNDVPAPSIYTSFYLGILATLVTVNCSAPPVFTPLNQLINFELSNVQTT